MAVQKTGLITYTLHPLSQMHRASITEALEIDIGINPRSIGIPRKTSACYRGTAASLKVHWHCRWHNEPDSRRHFSCWACIEREASGIGERASNSLHRLSPDHPQPHIVDHAALNQSLPYKCHHCPPQRCPFSGETLHPSSNPFPNQFLSSQFGARKTTSTCSTCPACA